MNFKLICKNNVFYADSRQVAELVDKRHDHLVRDIERYISAISTNPNLGALDFFVESSYVDKKAEAGKTYYYCVKVYRKTGTITAASVGKTSAAVKRTK